MTKRHNIKKDTNWGHHCPSCRREQRIDWKHLQATASTVIQMTQTRQWTEDATEDSWSASCEQVLYRPATDRAHDTPLYFCNSRTINAFHSL